MRALMLLLLVYCLSEYVAPLFGDLSFVVR